MKPFVRETLERQRLRLHELDALLSAPDAVADMERFRKLTREHADTDAVVQPYLRYLQREADLREAEAMCKDSDADMAAMAQDEAAQAQADLAALDTELQTLLLPKDPDDERHAFLEIRAGTGGDEAALFAGDLARMYTRYAERQGWRVCTRTLRPRYATVGPTGFAVGATGEIAFGTHYVEAPKVLRTFVQLIPTSGLGGWARDQIGTNQVPAIGPNLVVYFTDEVGALRAYQTTGENKWTTVLDGYTVGGVAFDRDGNLYLGTDGGRYNRTSVWSVSPDGTIRWTRETRVGYTTPAISPDGRIVIASLEGAILALDTNGAELWRVTGLPSTLALAPLAMDHAGNVYYRHPHGLTSFDRDGQTRWTFHAEGIDPGQGGVVLDRAADVYLGAGDLVYSLDQNGQTRWTVNVPRPSQVVVAGDGLLYVVSDQRRIVAIGETAVPSPHKGARVPE
jgi:outer membrane protein assembly factor BamB